MKTMIVCGDSFMTAGPKDSETANEHFAEKVANELNYNIEYFARQGMSNGGVALQIETAIKEKPDLILVGISHYDRIEFPYNEGHDDTEFHVDNIFYGSHYNSLTYIRENNRPSYLISTNLNEFTIDYNTIGNYTINSIINGQEKLKTIKEYLKWLYYPAWKKKLDKWVMYSILHQLHTSNINYVICFDLLQVSTSLPWINNHQLKLIGDIWDLAQTDMVENIYNNKTPRNLVIAHTTIHCQTQIAKIVLEYLDKNI